MEPTKRFPEKPIDVVGIGNAIVDVLVQKEESFLDELGLDKGSMNLVNENQANEIYKSIGPGITKSGGSAANTLAGLAQLGSKAVFIGRVKKDSFGQSFIDEIRSVGTSFNTPAAIEGPPTAHCLIIVTPDAQRTMCTYLGASVQLEPDDLDLSSLSQTKIVYLEGYLWDSPPAKRAFITAAKTCKEASGQVALSLSDSFCVDRHRESFLELLHENVDILFANESEIISLYKSPDLEHAINKTKGNCKVAVITCSERGSVILSGEQRLEVPAYKLGKVIDTTGAGDLYAGGFLHGYTKGLPLYTCGNIGSLCAGQVITEIGPRSNVSLQNLIETHLG